MSSATSSSDLLAKDPLATIRYPVMWTRLTAIVEEQARSLIKTAFSETVSEAGDLSAGVYDTHGKMLAQAVTGTPGHVNAMADAVAHFIRRIGRENIIEGDVYITNDPWEGTGHLHDITMVTPSFHKGVLVGFFACTAHIVDIGGRGFGADAASVYEEGLYIPIMKFAAGGEVDETLVRIIRGNVREPDQLVGDIFALTTCNEIGHRRLVEMMEEFDLDDLDGIGGFILENSRRATLERINALPRTSAEGEMTVDGFDVPITLKARVSVEEDRIVTNFSDTSGVDKKGINCPMVYTKAYASYAIKCVVAPDIPNNSASLAAIEVTSPENIVNAGRPAPVSLRHVIGHMVPDVVLGALAQALPGQILAEGAGALWNIHISARPVAGQEGRRAEVLMFNSGGMGARPGLDGLSATAFPSGVHTMPIEATEHTGPIVIWRKEYRQDSGGAGTYRGGLGQTMEITNREGAPFGIFATFERTKFPARGREGAAPGALGQLTLASGPVLRNKGFQVIPEQDRLIVEMPGGGGYGDPFARDVEAVRNDVQQGLVSRQAAERDYGVCVRDDLTLDPEATARRRAAAQ